ncbi:MAG: hypothetical protein AM1032_000405 [Mycoplasmataceae bacterium]|nr:MAG: hypothetical protein AM1032_000405 [Mycoplasmataceae bacterium]
MKTKIGIISRTVVSTAIKEMTNKTLSYSNNHRKKLLLTTLKLS